MYPLVSNILRPIAGFLSSFGLFFALLSTPVVAKDLVSARGYWEEIQGQATLDEAQAQPYKAYEGVLARGYTDATVWLRLRVEPVSAAHAGEKLVLRVRPSF